MSTVSGGVPAAHDGSTYCPRDHGCSLPAGHDGDCELTAAVCACAECEAKHSRPVVPVADTEAVETRATYAVHVRQDWVYLIEAESADAAADSFTYDPPDRGECTGYDIEAVTTPDDTLAENDLRSPGRCADCGRTLDPGRWICGKCLLARPLQVGASS